MQFQEHKKDYPLNRLDSVRRSAWIVYNEWAQWNINREKWDKQSVRIKY